MSNSYGDTVSVIDTATNVVIATIAFADGPRRTTRSADNQEDVQLTHGLVNPTLTPDGTRVYVAKSVGGGIAVIDVATNSVTGTIDVEDRSRQDSRSLPTARVWSPVCWGKPSTLPAPSP